MINSPLGAMYSITKLLSLPILLLCYAIGYVLASWGDMLYSYRDCLFYCKLTCSDDGYPGQLPMSLKIFGWTCLDECKYTCMHKVTEDDVINNRVIKQFHGKVVVLENTS